LLIEAAFGYPDALFRTIRHPVVWIGALINLLDNQLNREDWSGTTRRIAGVGAVLVLCAVSVAAVLLLTRAMRGVLPFWADLAVEALLASTLFAQRSLYDHVRAVADGLRAGGLEDGRRAVAMIVGRNPASLDEAGVCRAAIESLAENFADGVVSPVLWAAIFGLPGLVFYKAVNTADSMIGHRTPRHEAFGWAAARLDDVVNLPGARVAAILLVKAAFVQLADWMGAMRAAWRDAGRHRSPNAGWPEAAMAGAIGLRLAGPRIYGQTRVEDAWMGDGTYLANEDHLRRALALYGAACTYEAVVVTFFALIARG
jgi:adenosylcobinamide-phosphate synthase